MAKASGGVPSVAQRRKELVLEIAALVCGPEGFRAREISLELLHGATRLYHIRTRALSRKQRLNFKNLLNFASRAEYGSFGEKDFGKLCQCVTRMGLVDIEGLRSIMREAKFQATRERQSGEREHWPL